MAPPTPAPRPLIVLATLVIALVVGLQGAVAAITDVTYATARREAAQTVQSPIADASAQERTAVAADVTSSPSGDGPALGAPAGPHHHHADHTPAAANQSAPLARNPQAYTKASFWDLPPRLLATSPPRMKRPPRPNLPRTA